MGPVLCIKLFRGIRKNMLKHLQKIKIKRLQLNMINRSTLNRVIHQQNQYVSFTLVLWSELKFL